MLKKSQVKPSVLIAAAASGLIILAVLTTIFYSKSLDFTKKVDDCKLKGGECVPENECSVAKLDICQKQGEVCCLSTCKTRGGICRDFCNPDEEKVYVAECTNDQTCCSLKRNV